MIIITIIIIESYGVCSVFLCSAWTLQKHPFCPLLLQLSHTHTHTFLLFMFYFLFLFINNILFIILSLILLWDNWGIFQTKTKLNLMTINLVGFCCTPRRKENHFSDLLVMLLKVSYTRFKKMTVTHKIFDIKNNGRNKILIERHLWSCLVLLVL